MTAIPRSEGFHQPERVLPKGCFRPLPYSPRVKQPAVGLAYPASHFILWVQQPLQAFIALRIHDIPAAEAVAATEYVMASAFLVYDSEGEKTW